MPERRIPSIRKTDLHKSEALYDGVQPWMHNSVRNWLDRRLKHKRYDGRSTYYSNDLIHKIELHGRINLGVQEDDIKLYWALLRVFDSNKDHALDILQAAVELSKIVEKSSYFQSMEIEESQIKVLNKILTDGGSKWHFVIENRKARLEARVNQTTTASYQRLLEKQTDFAEHLKTAWEYCYGRGPSPSEAYTYSVKAVEAVAWQLITPANTSSTLGTLIRDLDAKNKAGKVTSIYYDKEAGSSVDMILKNMKRLWQGHNDRHATGNHTRPTQSESETAVHLAILLCHIFSPTLLLY